MHMLSHDIQVPDSGASFRHCFGAVLFQDRRQFYRKQVLAVF